DANDQRMDEATEANDPDGGEDP
ncbi:hypothetical protein SLA2020_343390, partial [Shorea laevis]